MRGGLAWRFSAAVATAALAPMAVSAQQAPVVFQPGERVQDVDVIGQIIYQSNVASTSGPLAAARGLKPADVIFQPGLHFEIARPIGRETAYVEGDAGYDFHVRDPQLNRENIDVRPGVMGQIGPCQTDVNGEYSRAQSDLAEIARSPNNVVVPVQIKNVLQLEEVGGDASCVRATGFGPSVTASETWTQNSAALERFIDAQTFSGSAGLTYQRPVLGSFRIFGAYSQTNFPHRLGLASLSGGVPIATGYRTVSGGLTYTRAIGSRLQGSASLSYTKLSEQGAALPGFSGPTYSAALTYLVSSRLRATGIVSRSTVPSIRLNSTFGIDSLYSGVIAYDLSARLTLDAGGSYAHDTFNGVSTRSNFDLTDEKIYIVYGDVILKLNRRMSLALNVQQIQRNANFVGLSYPDTVVGLTVRAGF